MYTDYHMENHIRDNCLVINIPWPFDFRDMLPHYIPREWHDRIRVLHDEKGVHFIWTGWSDGKGHGKISKKGKAKYVHREVIESVDGIVLASDDIVDHLCRHRGCINRDHLEVVTMKVNTDRGLGKQCQFRTAEEYAQAYVPWSIRYRDPIDALDE